MNYHIKFLGCCFISLLFNSPIMKMKAQTLSPQVIASSGGYQTNATASLSFTIGEANTKTLQSATTMLTQGFQQPFKLTLNLKAFIEGYYQGSGTMENVLYTQGITASAGNECDTIQIELHSATSPYGVVSSSTQVIKTDGTVTYAGTATPGQSYYIVIKHRNALQTWSANPVLLTENTLYDFTTDAANAYNNNMTQVEPGVWAFYAGDLNQDENMDLLDLTLVESDIMTFQFGYFASDINGDGNVDLLDSPILEANINSFVFSNHP